MERVVLLAGLVAVVKGQQQAISYQNFRTGHGQGYPTYQSDGSWSQSFGGGHRSITTHPLSFGPRNAFNHYQPNIPSYPINSHLYDTGHSSLYDVSNPSFYNSGANPAIYNPVPHNPIFGTAPNPAIYDSGPNSYDDPEFYSPDPSTQNYIPPGDIPIDTNLYQTNTYSDPPPQPYVPNNGFVPSLGDYTNPPPYPPTYDSGLVSPIEPQEYDPNVSPGPSEDIEPNQNYAEQDGSQNHPTTYAPEAEQRNIEENVGGSNYRNDGFYQNEGTYQNNPNEAPGAYNSEGRNTQYSTTQNYGPTNSPNPTISGQSTQQDYPIDQTKNDYRSESTNYKPEIGQATSRIEGSSSFKKESSPNKPYSRDSFEGYPSSELGHGFENEDVMPGYHSTEGFSNENFGTFDSRSGLGSYETNDGNPTSTSSFSSTHKNYDRSSYRPQDNYNKNLNYTPQRRFETDVRDSNSKEGEYSPKDLKQRSLERDRKESTVGLHGKKHYRSDDSRSRISGKKGLVKDDRKSFLNDSPNQRTIYLEKKLAQEAEKLAPSEVNVEKAFVKKVPFTGESRIPQEVRVPYNKSKKNAKGLVAQTSSRNFD